MSGKELRLLIVAECGDSVALAEAEALRPVVGRLDCVTVPAGAEGLLGRLGNRLKVRKAVRQIMGQRSLEFDAVVTYGTSVAGEVGVGLSGATGVRHIAREELYTSIGCAVVQMSAVGGHRTEDHALTFVSADNGQSTLEMMVGMAVARPGSRIEWRVAGDAPVMQEGGLRIPENLVVESCGSIDEALGRGAVDWMVDFSGSHRPPFVDLCRALSAGCRLLSWRALVWMMFSTMSAASCSVVRRRRRSLSEGCCLISTVTSVAAVCERELKRAGVPTTILSLLRRVWWKLFLNVLKNE